MDTPNATRPAHVPYGYCWCGCGERTALALRTRPEKGLVEGQPTRYLRGHNNRKVPWSHGVRVAQRDFATPCWEWTRRRNASGYGTVKWFGRSMLAHRLSFETAVGPVPDGLELDHLCRNRACVRPDHLEPVIRAVNTQRGKNAKLTPGMVRAIRADQRRQVDIAADYGVTQVCISSVKRRETWRNVPD